MCHVAKVVPGSQVDVDPDRFGTPVGHQHVDLLFVSTSGFVEVTIIVCPVIHDLNTARILRTNSSCKHRRWTSERPAIATSFLGSIGARVLDDLALSDENCGRCPIDDRGHVRSAVRPEDSDICLVLTEW